MGIGTFGEGQRGWGLRTKKEGARRWRAPEISGDELRSGFGGIGRCGVLGGGGGLPLPGDQWASAERLRHLPDERRPVPVAHRPIVVGSAGVDLRATDGRIAAESGRTRIAGANRGTGAVAGPSAVWASAAPHCLRGRCGGADRSRDRQQGEDQKRYFTHVLSF